MGNSARSYSPWEVKGQGRKMERCQKSQLSLCLPVVMSGYSGLLRYVCFLQDSMTTVAMVSLGQFASALFNSQMAVKEECSELEDHIY